MFIPRMLKNPITNRRLEEEQGKIPTEGMRTKIVH